MEKYAIPPRVILVWFGTLVILRVGFPWFAQLIATPFAVTEAWFAFVDVTHALLMS